MGLEVVVNVLATPAEVRFDDVRRCRRQNGVAPDKQRIEGHSHVRDEVGQPRATTDAGAFFDFLSIRCALRQARTVSPSRQLSSQRLHASERRAPA
jgi:hypothetical protein